MHKNSLAERAMGVNSSWMRMIFGRPRKKGKWVLGWIAALVFLGGWMGPGAPVQAHSFKRLYRDGVIYYYFSKSGKEWGYHAILLTAQYH
jgi:hypothetical protein